MTVATRRRLGGALMALLVVGCIDTAVGLVVELQEASVTVGDEGAGEVIRVDLEVFVRVGEYALSGDEFELPRAEIYVGDAPVAQINLDRPEGFTGVLEPGESTTVQITGSVDALAFPEARAQLCAADAAEILVLWTAETQPDDPLDPPNRQMGQATLETPTITCN